MNTSKPQPWANKDMLIKRFFLRLGRVFWSWGFLKCVLGVVALLILFYVEEDWRGARAWAVTKTQWEAKGESFDYNKFIPPPVPDDQNLAAIPLFKLELVKDTEGRSQLNAVNLQKALGSDYPHDDLPPLGAWQKGEQPDMDKVKQVIARNYATVFKNGKPPDNTLAQFDAMYPFVADFLPAASARHSFRYSQDYYTLMPPVVRPLGPITLPIKLTKIITLHAILALDHQQSDLALKDIEASYTLASGIRHDPSLIGGLVAVGILAISHTALYDGLVYHRWNDVQLAEVEHALGELNLLADYQFAVRSEAAESVANLEFYKKSASENFVGEWFSLRTQNVPFVLWAAPPWPSGWWDQNISKLVTFHFQELATVDPQNRLAFPKINLVIKQQIDEESTKWDGYAPWNIWFIMAASDQTEMMLKFAQAQVWIDEARIACALERYRLAHGVYPGSLDALVPDCIDALPHDVMNGQPYHYQFRPDGTFLLYSVGWNQTDDGGKVAYKNDYQKSVDHDEGDWVWPVPRVNGKVNMPTYETTVTYSRSFLLAALRKRFMKDQAKRLCYVCVAIIVTFFMWLHFTDLSLLLFALFLLNVFCLSLIVFSYFQMRYQTLKTFKRMSSHDVKIRLDDSAFTISDETGQSSIYWKQFTKLWKQPDFLVLYLQKKPLTIPTTGLPQGFVDFIESKIQSGRLN